MIAEAKEIVEQGKKNSYCRYKLNLPADEWVVAFVCSDHFY
jgi:hypothetical protein